MARGNVAMTYRGARILIFDDMTRVTAPDGYTRWFKGVSMAPVRKWIRKRERHG